MRYLSLCMATSMLKLTPLILLFRFLIVLLILLANFDCRGGFSSTINISLFWSLTLALSFRLAEYFNSDNDSNIFVLYNQLTCTQAVLKRYMMLWTISCTFREFKFELIHDVSNKHLYDDQRDNVKCHKVKPC